MPASYPTSVKAFTTKADGPGNTILAAHINDLQLEVSAIETDLINGLAPARGGTGTTTIGANKTIPQSNGTALTYSPTLDISSATGGQIAFPATQNPSSDVNTLDDYEEGTFTPVIGGATSESGQAYSVQVGRYVKIGKLVHVSGFVQLSTAGTITGAVVLKGLPYALANVSNYFPGGTIGWHSWATAFVSVAAEGTPNTSQFKIYGKTAAATAPTALASSDVGNTSGLEFSATYVTDN